MCVKVNVMLPLDVINRDGTVKNLGKLSQDLKTLKNEAHIDGVMIDVWFGIVEREVGVYDFSGYKEIFNVARNLSLSVQCVMSWHQCGGNVGDECYIPLPEWVHDVSKTHDIYYKDQHDNVIFDYISLGADEIEIFPSNSATTFRTPLKIYEDFMKNFKSNILNEFDDIINVIEVGLGPCGELRYPSYTMKYWNFPGIGEFVVYDDFMKKSLFDAAKKIGKPEWAGPPTDAGTYNDRPENTGFFTNGWDSDYGKFFLTWYFKSLYEHADKILKIASEIFSSSRIQVASKIAGIHWWHGTDSHAAEITAGYYITPYRNGYLELAQLFKKYNVEFQFTCLEMTNESQESCKCNSLPEDLVNLTKKVSFDTGIKYSGENALPSYSDYQYNQMLKMANGLDALTYLRLCDDLMRNDNLQKFIEFVNNIHKV